MSLPVSVVAPMPSPRLIDPGTYSPHVEVNIPGLGKPLRDLVCGSVFNNLAQKANVNNLRTFTYNLIAKGEHKSQDYIELCEYAGNYCVNSYLKDKRKLESTGSDELPGNMTARIHDKVPEAITLWMTSLLPRFKDLEYEIGSSLAHKTKKLYNTYINSQTEIKNMSLDQNTLMALSQLLASQGGGQGGGTNAVLQALQQQNDPIIPVSVNGQIIQMPRSQALALKAAKESGQMGGMGSNVLAALGLGGQGNRGNSNGIGGVLGAGGGMQGTDGMLGGVTNDMSHNNQYANVGNTNNSLLRSWKQKRGEDIDEVEIVQERPSDSFNTVINLGAESGAVSQAMSVNKNPFGKTTTTAAPVAATPVATKGNKEMITTKRLNIQGGNDKDHAGENILMFGYDIARQTTPTYVKVGMCNARLASARPDKATFIAKDTPEPVDGDEQEPVYRRELCDVIVNSDMVVGNSNMDFVNTAREDYVRQAMEFPETKEKFYFSHGYSVKPVYHMGEDLQPIANSLYARMSSIPTFRQHLENMVAANAEALSSVDDYYSADAVRSVVIFAEAFNGHMTRLYNDFLRYELDTNVTIDSFVGDYKDLEVLVARRFGARGTQALDTYGNDVLSALRDGNSKAIKSYVADQETEIGVKISAIVETNVAVIVPFTEGELGIFTQVQPRYFDTKTNSALTTLVKNIAMTCEKLEFVAMNVFLITAEGNVLAVQQAAGQEDGTGFIIRRVSER